ncbi:hypothetical protein KBY96_15895 [Cyanobium sp. ATX 6A2]|uniref:hypothetical protein n=1 Tax=Cyanobium sp. ATX 6A2 TaxID=2823700 RepID=UPI0020CD698D|nr:hypothetical protein [Cyanobium sp. ATX 6A2]MCP9889398.1 hypothetical protein [Cyanobium sp. ATX 6A2]
MQHTCYVSRKNIGNHLFSYFFAKRVQEMLGPNTCRVTFAGISDLGLQKEGLEDPDRPRYFAPGVEERIHIKVGNHKPDLSRIAKLAGELPIALHIQGPVCNLALLPSLELCRALVPGCKPTMDLAAAKAMPYIDDYLFVHVRAGDILRPIHRMYMPLPIEFIKAAQKKASLPLLFYGQTSESWYIRQLRRSFPDCVILEESSNPVVDFEIGRIAQNLLIGVSSFSWLSGWLSLSARNIFLPKVGFLNPEERPDINLIPGDDKRFNIVSVDKYENPYDSLADARKSAL